MQVPIRFLATVAVALVVGCADKAKPDYAACIQRKASGDIEAAWKACNDAVSADPNSTSGKAAADTLSAIKSDYEKTKAEREAKEAQAAEAQRKAQAVEAAARVKNLRSRVTQEWYDRDPSATCTGKGLPPYKWKYSGGTYAEDAEVATADGCVAPYNFNGQNTDFCCPEKP